MYIKRSFLSIIFIALWVASVHHCVLELIVKSPIGSQQTQSNNDCDSHVPVDSSSHEEGAPCGFSAVKFADNSTVEFYPLLASLNSFTLKEVRTFYDFKTVTLKDVTVIGSEYSQLLSLTKASNAPPLLS